LRLKSDNRAEGWGQRAGNWGKGLKDEWIDLPAESWLQLINNG